MPSSPATQRSSTGWVARGNISKPTARLGWRACSAAVTASCQRWISATSCVSPSSTARLVARRSSKGPACTSRRAAGSNQLPRGWRMAPAAWGEEDMKNSICD